MEFKGRQVSTRFPSGLLYSHHVVDFEMVRVGSIVYSPTHKTSEKAIDLSIEPWYLRCENPKETILSIHKFRGYHVSLDQDKIICSKENDLIKFKFNNNYLKITRLIEDKKSEVIETRDNVILRSIFFNQVPLKISLIDDQVIESWFISLDKELIYYYLMLDGKLKFYSSYSETGSYELDIPGEPSFDSDLVIYRSDSYYIHHEDKITIQEDKTRIIITLIDNKMISRIEVYHKDILFHEIVMNNIISRPVKFNTRNLFRFTLESYLCGEVIHEVRTKNIKSMVNTKQKLVPLGLLPLHFN